jgi:outer membrane protein assembly factor BamD
LGLVLAAACASSPPEEEIPSAEVYYQRALETLKGKRTALFFNDVDYAKAIELFQEVIDNYPYSEYAVLAELKIADTHFDQEDFEKAASYYQDFVELHPNHPSVPYAIFRNGLCAYEQLRDADRDQAATREAVAQFRALLERYPDSEYAAQAQDMMRRSEDQLAAHELEIGDFYLQRQQCHAAVMRYQSALVSYPQHTERLTTMFHMGQALRCLGSYEHAIALYQEVLAAGPDPELGGRIEEELQELGKPD